MPCKVFVTGGAGFIGSHTSLSLLQHGYHITLYDSLENAFEVAIHRIAELAAEKASNIQFIKGDIRNFVLLDELFAKQKFDVVVHFAGQKSVEESVHNPLRYYDYNVGGSIQLVKAMQKNGCKKIIFSSSATVYGSPKYVPIDEGHPLNAVSPYGRTKLVIEDMFRDLAASDPQWQIILLRYFNPVGAHSSGRIGEHALAPTNLMPLLQAAALKQRPALNLYGTDYPTRDGTCIRDYIHVMDVAEGHVAALMKLMSSNDTCVAYNLGTGTGTTVLEMVNSFEEASRLKVPLNLTSRRPGDACAVWAANGKAEQELGWKARLTVKDMTKDQWRWAIQNPNGFDIAHEEEP